MSVLAFRRHNRRMQTQMKRAMAITRSARYAASPTSPVLSTRRGNQRQFFDDSASAGKSAWIARSPRDSLSAAQEARLTSLHESAVIIQCAIRRALAQKELQRRRELQTMLALTRHRSLVVMLLNFLVAAYVAFLLYLCLIFCIKFTAIQAESWILAALLSFVVDILLQQPLLTGFRTFLSLILILTRPNSRILLLDRLASLTHRSESRQRTVLDIKLRDILAVYSGSRNSAAAGHRSSTTFLTPMQFPAIAEVEAGRSSSPSSQISEDVITV